MKMSPQLRISNPIDLQSTSEGLVTRPSDRKNMKSAVPRRKPGSGVIKAFKIRQSDRYEACHVSQNAMLLMEAHAHFTNGLQSKERLLLLFTDSLIIAKTKSLYLKLKACVSLSDIWLASCIHNITDRKVTSKHSFVIGWPTTNYVATFSSSETKEKWLQALQWHTSRARQRVLPSAILLYVLLIRHPEDDSPATIAVAVDVSTTAENVVHYIKQECKLLREASDYQLCVNYDKEEETYALLGHELPFFILRHSLQSQQKHPRMPGEHLREAFSAAQQTEEAIKTPHFTIKTRTHTLGLFKSKRRRSLIDWALRRGHLNQSDDNVESHNASQKLFGQSLSSICPDGNLPKPITDLLYLLFCEGPETCGIFRRSANAKSCRILKERMNSGKSISPHEESVFVSASLITEFLRELPGGVLRCDLYEEWIEVLQIEEEQHKLYQIRSLFAQLPEENFTLLCHLFGVLHRIHSHSHVNLMTASNLALCIAPNMLWRSSKVSPELEGKSTLQVAELIQFLIENTPAVFGDDLESLFTSRIISEQETRDSADGPYLQHSSSEDTDQDFIVSSPLSPEVHPLFLPLAALSFKEKRRIQPFHVDAPASQGTYSCGTLDSISSQSSASMYTLGIGKLSQTRDRCLSEPVMYFATPQSQMLVHTPVIRQSSYDAAVIDNRTEQSQTSVGLSPEQQVHNSATGPRRRRYTFWKSPQIPSRFKHPAQKLASMSSLSSATTSSLSSLDSTLSLSSADLIPSPQHTQSQPFLFGAAARLQPVTPEMSRKRWTNVFTYDEEEKVDMWDQDLEMDKKERKFEEPPHAERVESEDSMKSIIMEVKAVQRQCTSDRQLLAEYGGLDTNALKSSDAHKPEHDVDSQAVSREPCCTQTLPMAKQIDNEMQESKLKQTPLGAPQIITKKDNSESQLRCLNVRSVIHASGVQKVSRMKITFFPSARKVMLKHSKVRDQTSKSVTMETEQNEKPGFTEQKEAKWGESLEVTIPQTLFYGLDVPLVLCSETSQQTSIQVNASMPSFEDVGVRDAGVDVSMISGNSGLGNGVCGFPDKNTVWNLECVTCDKVISCVNATDAPHNPGSIIENAQPAVSISSGSGIIRSISIFHGNANQGTLPPKPASKLAGTFRRTICIKLPVNVRNRGAVQNKL
ncbi:Rho GTPase-activating protein 20 [Triplophysa tibetana]|uniref:Rho GTPase-activating protein 20 n=1 Tax=Triplophysa tibetana TaxID=1572043 RepID=A0A5A9P4H6_9TELE|nr:Rho GTPase-activating protein 20 [Triplophysa tibetana]